MNDQDKFNELKKAKLLGRVSVSYASTLVLPLDIAHKLQALLAYAVKLDTEYVVGSRNFNYVTDYDGATVEVFTPRKRNFYNAIGITYEEREAWAKACKKGLEDNPNASPDELMEPHLFASMQVKGEQSE